ncbi:MAG: GTP-binding protein [bacterium]|nr:GTP-binding protein [bacterium]
MRKFYLNVAVLGHVDHGKTTLTSALTKFAQIRYPNLNRHVAIDKIDNSPEERDRSITINVSHVPITFPDREVSISDCPGHQDYINNMISGASRSDFGILVVAATDGMAAQSHQHVNLAASLGVIKVFVVINKVDAPGIEELLDLVEEEVRSSLNKYNMEIVGLIKVSALRALREGETSIDASEIGQLLDYMQAYDVGEVAEGEKFRLLVEGV